jgi:hypothetical protein
MYTKCSELAIFMNNLLTYCGLVDARISASKKDLPVQVSVKLNFERILSLMIGMVFCFQNCSDLLEKKLF